MEYGRNFVDVSCYLLFEASGDSEADSDTVTAVIGHDNAVADDDAESCSCDFSDYVRVNEFKDCGVQEYEDDDDDDNEEEDDDDDDNEEEDEVNSEDQTWKGKEMGLRNFASKIKRERDKKSRVCVDTSKEVMNETEKNKLFWETCLDS